MMNTSGDRRGVEGRSAKQVDKFKFKVVVNNAGEILTFYTVTTSPNNAKRNALTQLAQRLGHNPAATIMRLKDRATVSLAGV